MSYCSSNCQRIQSWFWQKVVIAVWCYITTDQPGCLWWPLSTAESARRWPRVMNHVSLFRSCWWPGVSITRGTPGTRMHYRKASRHVMLWAMFCWKTLGPAIHVNLTFTHPTCLSIVPLMETVFPDGRGLFLQDNASCHKAKWFRNGLWSTTTSLRSLFAVQNSPDLNPITHLWDVLNKLSNLNLQDLKDLLLTSWRQIPQHTFRGPVDSNMSERNQHKMRQVVIKLCLIGVCVLWNAEPEFFRPLKFRISSLQETASVHLTTKNKLNKSSKMSTEPQTYNFVYSKWPHQTLSLPHFHVLFSCRIIQLVWVQWGKFTHLVKCKHFWWRAKMKG